MTLPSLGPLDLALAGLFAAAAGGLSVLARLGLERAFWVALIRMITQLLLVGIVLKFVFEQGGWAWTLALAVVMIVIAAHEASGRAALGARRWLGFGLAAATLTAIGAAASVVTTAAIMGADPWYAPSVVLPILGMILGNALSAMSLAMLTLTETARRDRRAIEARLALGATRLEALSAALRSALRTAMTPVINMLAVAGVVSLPGMMTGQILAGADALEAAKYQVMILAVIAGTSALALWAGAFGAAMLVTDSRDRLRLPDAEHVANAG